MGEKTHIMSFMISESDKEAIEWAWHNEVPSVSSKARLMILVTLDSILRHGLLIQSIEEHLEDAWRNTRDWPELKRQLHES